MQPSLYDILKNVDVYISKVNNEKLKENIISFLEEQGFNLDDYSYNNYNKEEYYINCCKDIEIKVIFNDLKGYELYFNDNRITQDINFKDYILKKHKEKIYSIFKEQIENHKQQFIRSN